MDTPHIDLDKLATHLRARMETDGLSLRSAAAQIGTSPATLARLLQGTESPNVPDSINLIRAVSWLDRPLSEFEPPAEKKASSLGDVEVHLRALPYLSERDAEALVAMVKAAYESASKIRGTKKPKR